MSTASPRAHAAPWYRPLVALYDRTFRLWHGLDSSDSKVGPALRIEIRRNRRMLRFADGTVVPPGERVCSLHLNNEHVRGIHADCTSPVRVGLEFRRELLESLHDLARMTRPGGPLAGVRAFEATTVFHQGLRRIGFEAAGEALVWPRLVSMYQRALLATLHPAGRLRLHRPIYLRAQRLWISAPALNRLHGDAPFSAARGLRKSGSKAPAGGRRRARANAPT